MAMSLKQSNGTVQERTRSLTNSKMFEAYWDEKDVESGLLDGSLIEGVIRINSKNYKEAYIASPDGTEDILIEGLMNRNRALNGDVIVCRLLPVNVSIPSSSPGRKIQSQEPQHKTPKKQSNQNETKLAETNSKSKSEACQTNLASSTTPVSQKLKSSTQTAKSPKKLPQAIQSNSSNINDENQKTPKEAKSLPLNSKSVGNKTRPKKKIKTPNGASKENEELVERNSDVKKKKTRRSKRNKRNVNEDKSETAELSQEPAPCDAVNLLVAQMSQMDVMDSSLNIEVKETEEIDKTAERKIGKVVYIKELKHSRRAIGHLRSWPYGLTGPIPKWVLFSPKDHRVPRFKIPFTPEVATCMSNPNMLFLAEIVTWEDINHPLGSLSYCVGNSGDMEAETVGLLLEHEVDYSPFPTEVLETLPQLPWSIPPEEIEKRRDYRDQCIFTIDPSDARDLDDAVCGRFLKMSDDGETRLFQFSVHIADVSFFIPEKSILDGIASQRATSTYLVDRVIPMLPSVLCEHVCSLNPGEDRLAFSVEWIITDKGEILEEWFGRSIIKSCVKLSYDHAQAVIEGKEEVDWPEIKGPHTITDIRQTIQVLQEMAGYLRRKRVDQGALRIDLPRLAFSMDWKTRTPVGFRVYELKESNRLIEEFMLLANTRVAEKIYRSFPSIAVLRSHPPPHISMLEQLANTLETIGIHLDISSSAALQESLIRYGQNSNDPLAMGRNLVISNLLAKPMKCAMYMCSGLAKSESHYRHYALSVPFYTHFTSPIRRYPDILVHRLLDAALEKNPMEHWEPSTVKKLLDNCNSRKLAAKALQDQHSELHLANLIRKSGCLEVKGIVLSVLDRSVDVVLLYLGVIRRLYFDKLPLKELTHDKYNGIGKLTLLWSPETPSSPETPKCQVISVFSMLEIQLVPHAEANKLDFSLVLQRPSHVN
nr:EOG090X047D [Eurycercus lamellatus]